MDRNAERRATGLGRRVRGLGDDAERARQTVTARIRDVLRKLREPRPEPAGHLDSALSTGAYSGYSPATAIPWPL